MATTDIPDDNDALKAALIETRAKLSGADLRDAQLGPLMIGPDRLLPAAASADAAGCEARAEGIARAWLSAHPDLTGQGWRCQPLAGAEALDLVEVAPGVHVHRGTDAALSPAPSVDWQISRRTPVVCMASMMTLVPGARSPPLRPAPSETSTAS